MSSAKSNVQRSWTPSDETDSKKWSKITVLSLLLAVAICGLAFFMPWRHRPVTFVTSLAVPEYSEEILPEPAYPDWNLTSLSKSLPESGLESWKIAKKAEVKTANDIVQWLGALNGELDGLNKKDTVVVYLRAHAINHRGKAFLLTGEFERKVLFDKTKDADDLIGAVSLESVFRDLQRVNASQVVLLADICDLQTAPQLGIIANDVPHLVASELEKLSDGTPLWVITASASLQTTHASNLKQRTLLQSASEYALNSRHCDSGDEFLSLAVFYEAVLRYSHHVTGGNQTPLLFRNGHLDPVTDPISPDWKKASKVSFARFDSAKSKASKKAEDAIQSKSAATDAAASTTSGKEKDSAVTESAEGKKDDKKDEVEVAETSPSLRYWQLRDKLQSRTTLSPEGWSPVDFAAEDWLQSSLEAVRLERLTGIGNEKAEKDLKAIVDDLEELSRALQSNSPPGNTNFPLTNAWQAIDSRMTPESDNRAWLFPNDLPESQQKKWKERRANYRIYFDAMGQLSGWLTAALNEQEQNRNELLSAVDTLVVALADLKVDLPKADDSLLDKPLPPGKVETIRLVLKQLSEKRNKQVNDLLTKLNAAKSKSKPLSWADERAIQQLRQDTNLPYLDRKRIRIALDGLTAKELSEPGTANNDVDKLLDMTSLLNPSQVRSSSLEQYATWCSLYSRAIAITGATEMKEPSGTENLNSWGHNLIVTFKAAPVTGDPTMCWKQACLNEFQIFNFGGEGCQSGMLLSVSKDKNIDVVVPKQIRLSSAAPQPLTCAVKRHNGTSVPECWLQWELIEPVNYKESTRALLSVKMQGSDNLDPGMLYPATVRGGKVDLMMTSSKDSKDLREELKIRIGIATEQSAKEPLWHEVQVLLPNPDRIDLYAKCLDPAVGNSRVFYSKAVDFGSVLRGLSVPAVNGQAKSRYELYLLNRSDEAKTVRAKLYAVAGGRTNGNGSILSKPPPPTAVDTPYFQTTSPIVLPKNNGQVNQDGSPVGGVRMELAAVPTAAGATPKALYIGEFGLVLVIEEIEVGENKVERSRNKNTFQWIECRYTKPVGELLKITPIASEGVFDFKLEVPPSNWERWGLKELEIKAHLTDAKGAEVARYPGSTSLILTPDMTEAPLRIKPKQPSADGKLVVHFDIGGYPRAIAFDSWLKGELDETRNASQAFVWLEPDGALFYTGGKDPKLVTAYPKDKDTLVIPRREQTADAEIGKEINIARFSMPFRVDFPRAGDKSATFSLSEGNLSQKFLHDRRFIPTFEVEGGNLVFSAAVEDLIADFAIQNAGVIGKLNAQVKVTESSGEPKACALVFDRDPPNKASVECSSLELYEGESISLSLDSSDDDSAVNQVFFAIDQSGINEGEFDKNDLIHRKANQLAGTWIATLEATMLEELPPGRYSIVARSIDMAGNVQDGNTPRSFRWMGKKRAADKPAAQPAAKKSVADPPPKKDLKKTVMVQVTVDGQQPAIPRNIQVKGITGDSETKNGATTIFTKVPEGAYDVTATYKDAFGKPFEGAGKIKVSADSPSILRIDLKPLK